MHGGLFLFNIAGGAWFHYDFVYGPWGPETAVVRLGYCFWLAMFQMAIIALQAYGLVARNLARIKLKLSRDGVEVE